MNEASIKYLTNLSTHFFNVSHQRFAFSDSVDYLLSCTRQLRDRHLGVVDGVVFWLIVFPVNN
jgi:hypothetical protein